MERTLWYQNREGLLKHEKESINHKGKDRDIWWHQDKKLNEMKNNTINKVKKKAPLCSR